MLSDGADGKMTASRWGDFRQAIAPGIASVRSVVPKRGRLGELRASYLAATNDLELFAYAQQEKNWRDKYPKGYEQFTLRNQNLDVSEPKAALERAQSALDTILATAREEEWGVAVSIGL